MAAKERQTKILQTVNERQKIDVASLAGIVGVSQVTVRKDLDVLEEKGLLCREHGYALAVNSDDINNRLAYNYETKLALARKAAEIVGDGETVMIESGSSCALLAEVLSTERTDVNIITNSAFIANHIKDSPTSRVTLLGGEFQRESQVCVGALVRTCAKEFYVDKLFVGTDGFVPEVGFTGGDLARAEAVRAMAVSAKNRIILTDSSKFTAHGLVLLLRFDEISMVFTDSDVPQSAVGIMEEHGVKVFV